MSGICGLFNFDGAPIAKSQLRAMTAMLEKRGPDGTGMWQNGQVGLGHTMLATTPELLFEQQPFTHAETGCVITADVRLDNREELLRAFDLLAQGYSIGDAELILQAYLKWGEDCLDRLLGDFAFAISDPRHEKLFCARDHFGLRPFYYHHAPGRRFVFASDARAILVLPQVPYKIDEGRVADFLVPELQWIDYTSTFYEGVFRLPPGNKASGTRSGIEIAEYWRPQPGPDLGRMSDEDYEQGFLEVFTQAVEARLRAPAGTVGSMLSGGMDSGSVVAVGKEILRARGDGPLPTYSGVQRKEADCDESRAIYAALTMPSIRPTLIYPDALQDDFDALIADIEEPFDGEFMFLKSIYRSASRHGHQVILDGVGGDIVLANGTYIVRLIRQGKLKLALSEIAGECAFWGEPSCIHPLAEYARSALVPEAAKKRLRLLLNRRSIKSLLKGSLIDHDFAGRVNLEMRRTRLQQTFPDAWTPDYALERSNAILPNTTAGRERYARIAAGAAAEARDPFLDKRVVDFCSRLPARVRMKDGWPKMILRTLMAERLPDEVRWARGKPHVGWLFNDAVTRMAAERGELVHSGLQDQLGSYVDVTALAEAWDIFIAGGTAEPINTAYVLSLWLMENANRPVVPDRQFGYSTRLCQR